MTVNKKVSFVFMFVLGLGYISEVIAGSAGNVGTNDRRKNGSLEDSEYSAICQVLLGSNLSPHCTCGFIDHNIVITNSHCVPGCIRSGCFAKFWNGTSYVTSSLTPIVYNSKWNVNIFNGNDWALFSSEQPNPNIKQVAASTTLGAVKRGGYGILRVIPDEEIPTLRDIVKQAYTQHYQDCEQSSPSDPMGCLMKYIETAVESAGMQKLTGDGNQFKVQECNITQDFFSYGGINYDNMADTDCDGAGGDSGAPLFRSNMIVALNNSGPQGVFQDDDTDGGKAVKTQNFYQYIEQAKANLGSLTSDPRDASGIGSTSDDQSDLQQFYQQYLDNFQCD